MDRVAIATFIVAAATALLAAATFRLGSRAQDEIRAQWRPVIAINESKEVARLLGGGFSPVPAMQEAYVANDQLIFAVTNVGRGPALDVTAAGARTSRPQRPPRSFARTRKR